MLLTLPVFAGIVDHQGGRQQALRKGLPPLGALWKPQGLVLTLTCVASFSCLRKQPAW